MSEAYSVHKRGQGNENAINIFTVLPQEGDGAIATPPPFGFFLVPLLYFVSLPTVCPETRGSMKKKMLKNCRGFSAEGEGVAAEVNTFS